MRPISSVYQKTKIILLYTYTTTSSHNQSNPISPAALLHLAWLPEQPCTLSLPDVQTFLEIPPYTKYEVSDLPQVILF